MSEDGDKKTRDRLYGIWVRPGLGKVLIVEPDPDIARMLEVRLAREGHTVLLAENGRSALSLSSGEVIDVAVIDRSLGDMTGFAVLEQLQRTHTPFEAIMMSIDPTVEIEVRALELGAFDLVVKPFSNFKLVTAKVKLAVAKVRAERDRDELARILAAQTQDLAAREAEAERSGHSPAAHSPAVEALSDQRALGDSAIDLDGMSGIDPLTGLPNRRAAEDRFRKEASRALRYDRPLCIALASIDALDLVIGRSGSQIADGALRGVASLFSGMIRDVDFCARSEGGEFLFIFPETSKDSGFIVVDRIRLALSQIAFSEVAGAPELGFRLTVSAGIAGLPTDSMNADRLKEAAESALALARHTGDRVVAFEPSMLRRS